MNYFHNFLSLNITLEFGYLVHFVLNIALNFLDVTAFVIIYTLVFVIYNFTLSFRTYNFSWYHIRGPIINLRMS